MLQHLEKCELVQEILSQNFKISEYIHDDAGGALEDDDNDEWNIQE